MDPLFGFLRRCLGFQTPTHKVFGRLGIQASHIFRDSGVGVGLGNSMGFQEVPLLLGVPENRTEALMVCHGLSGCDFFSKKVDDTPFI